MYGNFFIEKSGKAPQDLIRYWYQSVQEQDSHLSKGKGHPLIPLPIKKEFLSALIFLFLLWRRM